MGRMIMRLSSTGIVAVLLGLLIACQTGYGLKVGYQRKSIKHTGYTSDQIFDAAQATLAKLGRVTYNNRKEGVIKGEIPPYTVEATVTRGSSWLKLVGREEEHGVWKRDKAKGEWFLSIDGKFYYSVGAATLKDALKEWSHAINLRIP